jgi:hypothetical protein
MFQELFSKYSSNRLIATSIELQYPVTERRVPSLLTAKKYACDFGADGVFEIEMRVVLPNWK